MSKALLLATLLSSMLAPALAQVQGKFFPSLGPRFKVAMPYIDTTNPCDSSNAKCGYATFRTNGIFDVRSGTTVQQIYPKYLVQLATLHPTHGYSDPPLATFAFPHQQTVFGSNNDQRLTGPAQMHAYMSTFTNGGGAYVYQGTEPLDGPTPLPVPFPWPEIPMMGYTQGNSFGDGQEERSYASFENMPSVDAPNNEFVAYYDALAACFELCYMRLLEFTPAYTTTRGYSQDGYHGFNAWSLQLEHPDATTYTCNLFLSWGDPSKVLRSWRKYAGTTYDRGASNIGYDATWEYLTSNAYPPVQGVNPTEPYLEAIEKMYQLGTGLDTGCETTSTGTGPATYYPLRFYSAASDICRRFSTSTYSNVASCKLDWSTATIQKRTNKATSCSVATNRLQVLSSGTANLCTQVGIDFEHPLNPPNVYDYTTMSGQGSRHQSFSYFSAPTAFPSLSLHFSDGFTRSTYPSWFNQDGSPTYAWDESNSHCTYQTVGYVNASAKQVNLCFSQQVSLYTNPSPYWDLVTLNPSSYSLLDVYDYSLNPLPTLMRLPRGKVDSTFAFNDGQSWRIDDDQKYFRRLGDYAEVDGSISPYYTRVTRERCGYDDPYPIITCAQYFFPAGKITSGGSACSQPCGVAYADKYGLGDDCTCANNGYTQYYNADDGFGVGVHTDGCRLECQDGTVVPITSPTRDGIKYVCKCNPGSAGEKCDKLLSKCLSGAVRDANGTITQVYCNNKGVCPASTLSFYDYEQAQGFPSGPDEQHFCLPNTGCVYSGSGDQMLQKCVCSLGWAGATCEMTCRYGPLELFPRCSDRGSCVSVTSPQGEIVTACQCDVGFTGLACQVPSSVVVVDKFNDIYSQTWTCTPVPNTAQNADPKDDWKMRCIATTLSFTDATLGVAVNLLSERYNVVVYANADPCVPGSTATLAVDGEILKRIHRASVLGVPVNGASIYYDTCDGCQYCAGLPSEQVDANLDYAMCKYGRLHFASSTLYRDDSTKNCIVCDTSTDWSVVTAPEKCLLMFDDADWCPLPWVMNLGTASTWPCVPPNPNTTYVFSFENAQVHCMRPYYYFVQPEVLYAWLCWSNAPNLQARVFLPSCTNIMPDGPDHFVCLHQLPVETWYINQRNDCLMYAMEHYMKPDYAGYDSINVPYNPDDAPLECH